MEPTDWAFSFQTISGSYQKSVGDNIILSAWKHHLCKRLMCLKFPNTTELSSLQRFLGIPKGAGGGEMFFFTKIPYTADFDFSWIFLCV